MARQPARDPRDQRPLKSERPFLLRGDYIMNRDEGPSVLDPTSRDGYKLGVF